MSDEHSAEGSELTDDERAQIDHFYTLRTRATFYELLSVPPDANRKTIRDAYFELSKRYHPDVFFKRNLGPYRTKLDDVFRAFTKAYDVLSNAKQRSGYDLLIGNIADAPSQPPPAPTPSVPVPAPPPSMPPPAMNIPRDAPSREVIDVPLDPLDEPWSPPPSSTRSTPPSATQSSPPQATYSTPPTASSTRSSPPSGTFRAPMASSDVPITPTAPVPPPVTRAPRPFTNDDVSARAVVPPPVRASNAPAPQMPLRAPVGASAPVDAAARARAMEAMARRLSGSSSATSTQRPPVEVVNPNTTFPRPSVPDPEVQAAERRSHAEQLVAQGEEAQKHGNLHKALEHYKAAAQAMKDDESIKARVDAVTNLVTMQQTNEAIELAREAMRAGKADESAKQWERAWEGRQSDLNLLLNAADVIAKHTKDHKRAIEICQRIVMIDPKNTKALAIMARTFIDAGMRARARGTIESVAKLEPPNSPLVKELRDKLGPLTIAEQLGLRGR